MKRRKFLYTGLSGLGGTIAVLYGCKGTGQSDKAPAEAVAEFTLEEADISSLQQRMKRGELTARQICEQYLTRIQEIDQSGPKLNAVIELNPDALSIADERDRERAAGQIRGPLHGIPILIEDNIDTGDKMMTT